MPQFVCCGTKEQTVFGTAPENTITLDETKEGKRQMQNTQKIQKAGWMEQRLKPLSSIRQQLHLLLSGEKEDLE